MSHIRPRFWQCVYRCGGSSRAAQPALALLPPTASPLLCCHKTRAVASNWRITQKKWLFSSTRSVLDSDSLNKLNWRQSKCRNKQSWTAKRERKCINCMGQDKCVISICIDLKLKHNPLTCATKSYAFSWQTKSYTLCCTYSKAITDQRL